MSRAVSIFRRRAPIRLALARTLLLAFLPIALQDHSAVNRPAGKTPPVKEILISPEAKIYPPPENYTFPLQQTLVYNAEWHSFNAGTARLHLESSDQGRHAVVVADSAGLVNFFYKVHDSFRTTFDPRTFCSVGIAKHTEEGSRKRETDVRFDYARRKSVLREKNLKTGEIRDVEHEIPSCVTDTMSGFYYLGSLPFQNGTRYVFPLNDGGQTAEITATVEGREQLKTSLGAFNAVRIAALATAGPLKNKGRIWVWYSDDGQRLPLQMRANVKWGTLTVRLIRVEKNQS